MFVNDTWGLSCFGVPYPQELLFNLTDSPGYLEGYVPVTRIPGLPKDVVSKVVFPNTIVDFKAGPQGWSLEMQCVQWMGHVVFVGINYYSKVNSEAAFQEMDRAARARGLGLWLDHGFGLRRVSFTDCANASGTEAELAV
ncbi:unnamed protein product [Prorocentrum cordatum]|uniref:TNase-like domain-containing protein n=1 Tax=Prorocentrum cordatum TaxID=2364126 RepID=A0ABN9TR43_9DINO|nr:unnamed protein product [Polarella glacialis]